MLCHDIITFKRSLSIPLPPLCLILLKEAEERKEAIQAVLKIVEGSVTSFSSETFALNTFFQEVETIPLLSKNKYVFIQDADQLPSEVLDALTAYCAKPVPWTILVITAASLPSKLLKLGEKKGILFRSKEEKPWDKEKRLVEWLVHEAAEAKVACSFASAQALVKAVDPACLKSELEKLICYVGDRKEIRPEDVKKIAAFMPHETLWQLGDALFEQNFPKAHSIGKILLEEGMAIILLIAQLRGQMHTGLKILQADQNGGSQAVTRDFPYLKGTLLDKKLHLLRGFGILGIQHALIHLFDIEVRAKNSAADPEFLLEILIAKLTHHDTLSFAKRTRSC